MKRALCLLATVLILTIAVTSISAQSGGYDLTWSSIDGGGGGSSGGDGYSLSSIIGQADAGTCSGGYKLNGGLPMPSRLAVRWAA
jgi:hypothetical protein